MATEQFEDWEQEVLDRRIELEKKKIKESATNRANRPILPLGGRPRTVLKQRLIDALKVASTTLIIGTLVLLVISQLPNYFGGLIEFIVKVGEFIWSLIYNR